jgi:hypothetical protein
MRTSSIILLLLLSIETRQHSTENYDHVSSIIRNMFTFMSICEGTTSLHRNFNCYDRCNFFCHAPKTHTSRQDAGGFANGQETSTSTDQKLNQGDTHALVEVRYRVQAFEGYYGTKLCIYYSKL